MYERDGQVALGASTRTHVVDLRRWLGQGRADGLFCCTTCFLEGGAEALAMTKALLAESARATFSRAWPHWSEVTLQAPIPAPGKILALAGNYGEHMREGGGQTAGQGDHDAPRVH